MFPLTEKMGIKTCSCCVADTTSTRGQLKCIQARAILAQQTTKPIHSSNMASSISPKLPPFFFSLLTYLLVSSLSLPTATASGLPFPANQTFRPRQELQRINRIRSYLRKINKPSVKTIQAYFKLLLFFLMNSPRR